MTASIITSHRNPDNPEALSINTGILQQTGRGREGSNALWPGTGLHTFSTCSVLFPVAFARIIPIFHVKKLRTGEDSQGCAASVKQVFCLQNLALFFLRKYSTWKYSFKKNKMHIKTYR